MADNKMTTPPPPRGCTPVTASQETAPNGHGKRRATIPPLALTLAHSINQTRRTPIITAAEMTPLPPAAVANAIRAKTTAEIKAQRESRGPKRVVDVDDPAWLALWVGDWKLG